MGQRRLMTILLGVFAAIALLLSLIVMYGVIAYSVAQRTEKVGIRRALGAQRADILRLVLNQGFVLAFAGAALGIAASLLLARLMKQFLFEVSATDPVILVVTAALFVLVALAASLIPARRAALIDPMKALRMG